MYPANVAYHRASSVAEAIELLSENEDSKIIAGGHSLIPLMKLRLAMPSALIDIGRIDSLKGTSCENGTVRIGALTTHSVAGILLGRAVRGPHGIGGRSAHRRPGGA